MSDTPSTPAAPETRQPAEPAGPAEPSDAPALVESGAAPACSRSLLFPGPLPPLSHFGVTLLRHVVGTGLRYALHSLGAPLPESPPVRIVALRLYLDRGRLDELPAGFDGGREIVAALVDPGGVGPRSLPPALRGAVAFHGLRQRSGLRRRLPRRGARTSWGRTDAEGWPAVRSLLSALQPSLGDALLGELLAVLARRRARGRGRTVPPAVGPAARRLLLGRPPLPGRLGHPDPLLPAWTEPPAAVAEALRRSPLAPPPAADRLRGAFRESYRAALERLRVPLLALAERAAERGLVERPNDAFFLPFDLGEELDRERPASWLRAAVARNRAEYESLLDAPAPPDQMVPGGPERWRADDAERQLAPLWPLC